MTFKAWLVSGVVCFAATSASALTLASSGFDASDEGWQAQNGARGFEWLADGGDLGGHVSARDIRSDSLWFFAAPSAYLGDQASAYGGSLSFSLKSDSDSAPLAGNFADVQLLGNNGVRLAYDGDIAPSTSWAQYSVALLADGAWRVGSINGVAATAADMQGVLSDLRELRIRGDYKQAVETTRLDGVVLSAVPEPSSLLLVLGGLAVIAGAARRR